MSMFGVLLIHGEDAFGQSASDSLFLPFVPLEEEGSEELYQIPGISNFGWRQYVFVGLMIFNII